MAAEAVKLKDISAQPEVEQQAPDAGRHYIGGTMDAMIVFNDPSTQCQRSLKINRYIYADDSLEKINARADDTQQALERQFLRHDLKRMEKERATQLQNMEHHVQLVRDLSARKASRPHGKGLNQQELTMLENNDKTMAKAQEMLAEMDAKIDAAKKACGLA